MDLLNILDNRKHVRIWDEKIPAKDTIDTVLWKAWKVTPSKQNFMPYYVNVLGPDRIKEKHLIHGLSRKNKIFVNENANEGWIEPGINPDYDYIKTVPYLIVFSQRICKPNKYIQQTIDYQNDHYEQMHEHELKSIVRTTAVEVGIFGAHLTAFCLEEGLDTAYTCCFPSNVKDWVEIPIIKYNPMLIMGIGYCKKSRRELLNPKSSELDRKPEPEEIIKWV